MYIGIYLLTSSYKINLRTLEININTRIYVYLDDRFKCSAKCLQLSTHSLAIHVIFKMKTHYKLTNFTIKIIIV